MANRSRYETNIRVDPFRDELQRRYDKYLNEDGEPDSTVQGHTKRPAQLLAEDIGFIAGDAPQDLVDAAVRRLWRYRHGVTETKRDGKRVTVKAKSYPRSIVEDACHALDPDLFYELYPEFAPERDIVLEPDAWCPFCEEWVTPVDGLCPWCVCAHGHLFREVGVSDDGFVCLECARKEARWKDKYWCQWKERRAA